MLSILVFFFSCDKSIDTNVCTFKAKSINYCIMIYIAKSLQLISVNTFSMADLIVLSTLGFVGYEAVTLLSRMAG